MSESRLQLGDTEKRRAMMAILDHGFVDYRFDTMDASILFDTKDYAQAFNAAASLLVELEKRGVLEIRNEKDGVRSIHVNSRALENV